MAPMPDNLLSMHQMTAVWMKNKSEIIEAATPSLISSQYGIKDTNMTSMRRLLFLARKSENLWFFKGFSVTTHTFIDKRKHEIWSSFHVWKKNPTAFQQEHPVSGTVVEE